MYSYQMKYFIATTVLSCLLVNKAGAASSISTVSALAHSPMQNLASIDSTVDIPSKKEDVNYSADIMEEEEENLLNQDSENSNEVVSSSLDIAAAFAAAGLTYDKDTDLPVFSQRQQLEGEEFSPVPQVVSCRSEGQIAITYSEGPSNTTARIARQLNNGQTRVNFFVNTQMLNDPQYGIVLQNIYNAGHLIGMTYRLPTEDPHTMSDQDIKADIIDSAHKIETLIHLAPKYVRLHFSAQNDGRTEHILRELGFILVGYNLDGKDYVHSKPELVEQEYRRTFEQYQQVNDKKKGSFISIQYDIPETVSMDAVPYVMKLLEEEGYTAVRMDGCLNDPKPYKISAAKLEYTNDKFSFGTPGYKPGPHVAASIISDTTEEQEIRGLVADDTFLNTSNGAPSTVVSLPKLRYAIVAILVYAFSAMI